MKHLYKITKITDIDGKEKSDYDSKNRMGRIYLIDPELVQTDTSAFIECIHPSWFKSVITSHVKSILIYPDFALFVITTENSIYTFERITSEDILPSDSDIEALKEYL